MHRTQLGWRTPSSRVLAQAAGVVDVPNKGNELSSCEVGPVTCPRCVLSRAPLGGSCEIG